MEFPMLNHLDESIFHVRGIMGYASFLFHFSMKCLKANRIAPYGTLCIAVLHLGYSICMCPVKGTPGFLC